jgi:hypothetical protein
MSLGPDDEVVGDVGLSRSALQKASPSLSVLLESRPRISYWKKPPGATVTDDAPSLWRTMETVSSAAGAAALDCLVIRFYSH